MLGALLRRSKRFYLVKMGVSFNSVVWLFLIWTELGRRKLDLLVQNSFSGYQSSRLFNGIELQGRPEGKHSGSV